MYTFNKEYQAVIEVSGEYRLKNFCLGSFHKKYGIQEIGFFMVILKSFCKIELT